MSNVRKDLLFIEIPCISIMLPVILNFAEETAKILTNTKSEVFAIRLATEEIFSYLLKITNEDDILRLSLLNGGYFVELSFLFKGDIPLRKFNLTSKVSPDKEKDFDEVGLLIAARFVDSFKVFENNNKTITLSLIKEKSYPSVFVKKDVLRHTPKSVNIKKPDKAQLKLLSIYITSIYEKSLIPDFFSYPGKLVDMVNFGNYTSLIAVDDKNHILGSIIWHYESSKSIEFFGPYIFVDKNKDKISEKLIISCLESIGKSEATGLYSKFTADLIQKEFFEEIGALTNFASEDAPVETPVYFRQLKEDTGSICWCHRTIKNFLSETYNTLFLPRQLETVSKMGECFDKYSVIETRVFRKHNYSVMKIVKFGDDFNNNIKGHIELLKKENLNNIFFEIDTGIPEHAYVSPFLIENNFNPKVVIPNVGTGDIVVFQFNNV